MVQSLEQLALAHDNDYSVLEAQYRAATGSDLVTDPYRSQRCTAPPLTLTASVVIPAWNARPTLTSCLRAIEQSSFNQRYPGRLEAIVVDDGSTDGTWDLLERINLGVRLKALRQEHLSRGQAQNTGIAVAEGDVVIACDADMILASVAIEEMVKRHQVLERVMLIGFRADVDEDDPRIQPDAIATHLPEMRPPFTRDVRVCYGGGGWPESMCRDSDHLKRLGGSRQMVMADGSAWNLQGIVYGALFSLRRRDWAAMEGYDERFFGWGCEDTLVGMRACALGIPIIPVYAAAGWHVAHGNRSPRKWQEFAANRHIYRSILQSPFSPGNGHQLDRARSRVTRHVERAPSTCVCAGRCADEGYNALAAELADPDRLGKYLLSLGLYAEAAGAFAAVRGTPEQEAWAMFDRGKALRANGQTEEAVDLQREAATRLPRSPWPRIELALTLAAEGRFRAAREQLETARGLEPRNPTLDFVFRRPVDKHLERATFYARQDDHALALLDYEAALILDPKHPTACLARVNLLASRHLSHALLHLALGDIGPAKLGVEQARRYRARDAEVMLVTKEIEVAAAATQPLPLARTIVESSEAIPGWFGGDELELLVALALRTLAQSRPVHRPTLVEIGSYCGRATVAMAMAARGLGRTDARIVAVDEPSLGDAPDGRLAREVLREEMNARGLGELVVCAPEEESAPWDSPSQLLLVDGRHDEAGVRNDLARFGPCVEPGGFLVFHDYADYFPDVQRVVDEILLNPEFEFVAQASSLIALRRRDQIGTAGADA
jgi:glycosyltransferase involved in cell wall biosynthesis